MLDEVFRERPVEPLDGTIHLGTPRVGVVVANLELETRIMEEVGKLGSIVGLYLTNRERSDLDELREKVCGSLG